MTRNRLFPERTWKLVQAEGHPKRLRATIPKDRLGPFSKTQRTGRSGRAAQPEDEGDVESVARSIKKACLRPTRD